jgi:ParB family chromosome partitioning protein
LVVRRAGERFELVSGARRLRAARLAGLTEVPIVERETNDDEMLSLALIENLQREDLNPVERAHAFQALIDRFELSHDQIASQVNVDRSTISNTLRLLNLHEDLQAMVAAGHLSFSHARALAGVADPAVQMDLARRSISQQWSVRRLERTVNGLSQTQAATSGKPKARTHLADLEQQIATQLGTKVNIRPGRRKGTGTLCIDFYSIDQFDALLARLGVETE